MKGKFKNQLKVKAENVRMDRTVFRIVSFEKKGYDREYWLQKTVWERLCASWYLTCCAYNLPYSGEHKLDRKSFRMRKHGD